jgi:arginine exporter protein ArgO
MFTAIFAGFGLMGGLEYNTAVSLVSGVFLGSAIWWFILSGTIKLIRGRLSRKVIIIINRISGILLLGFACYALAKAYINFTF